jgi:WD40 repeat protein
VERALEAIKSTRRILLSDQTLAKAARSSVDPVVAEFGVRANRTRLSQQLPDGPDAKVWDTITGREVLTLSQGRGSGQVWAVTFSPDGSRIVTGYRDATAAVWDAVSGKKLLLLKGHTDVLTALAFSPDGRRILSGSWDNEIKLWDATSGEELLTLKGHTDTIRSVVFSPDGHRILSGSQDGTARLWETATADQVTAWQAATTGVELLLSNDN